MKALIDFDGTRPFAIPMAVGPGVREGMLIEGPQGWGEFSPPLSCDDPTVQRWLTAALEPGTVGWPDPEYPLNRFARKRADLRDLVRWID